MTHHSELVIRAAGIFGVPGATVVHVRDGRIAAVGGPELLPTGTVTASAAEAHGTVHPTSTVHPTARATVIDAGSSWLLPGLLDAHVHLGPGTARGAALHGVTTVIDQFSTPALLAEESLRITSPGAGPAASIRTSGIGATAPGGHPTMAYGPFPSVTGPDDAQAFVAARVAEGATHLKVIYDEGTSASMNLPSLSEATLRALVTAAHDAGLVVAAHVSTASGAVLVARCGVDVLAHVPFEPLSTAQVDELAAAGLAVIATLSLADGFPLPDGRLPLEADPVLSARLTPAWARVLRAQAQRWMPPSGLDLAAAQANVAALHAAGVPLLAGTDAPNPGVVVGVSLHRELGHLVRAGLSPAEAISAATSVPADVFGLGDRGRIRVGARADLVLVAADPSGDIARTGRVERVWIEGREVTPAADDDEAESTQIAWIGRTNAKITRAIAEQWPEWSPASAPEVLHLTGVAAVDEHLPALTHPFVETRQKAALALGTAEDAAAVPALVARLRDEPDFFVRETLTWALVRLADDARPSVEGLTASEDPAVVTQAVHALSKIGSPESLPVLGRLAEHPSVAVAAKARDAIARIGTPEGITLLARYLGAGDTSMQNQLTTALASCEAALVPAVVSIVGERLGDAEPAVRRHAADVLIHLVAAALPVAENLVPLLDDPDEEVRLSAAMALYEIGGDARAVLSGYDGADSRLRALARRA